MSWFAVDDRLPTHRKLMRLRRQEHFAEAVALWMLCGAWAAGDDQARDTGIVPLDVVAGQGVTEWRSAMDALVLVGLWDLDLQDTEVVRFHDWADWNGPDAKAKRIEKRLEADRIRQQNRRLRVSRDTSRDESRDSPRESRDGHVNSGYGNGNGVLSPESVETRDVTTSRHVAEPAREDVERICAHLADRVEGNGARRPTITRGWRDAARLLLDRDGRSEAQVHAAIDWCQDHEFWRANVLSLPKLREQYEQLRLQAARKQPATALGSAPTVSKTDAALLDLQSRAAAWEAEDRARQLPIGDPR